MGYVVALAIDSQHRFSKHPVPELTLIAGQGAIGDAHLGTAVQHRSRVAVDPMQPNLRQVHLIHAELFDELRGMGFAIAPGDLGENITTRGIDLLGLPRGSLLAIGTSVVLAVTGLRNPCGQIETFRPGLLAAVLGRDENGAIVRKAGVMSIVGMGGVICPGDAIVVTLPPPPHHKLDRV